MTDGTVCAECSAYVQDLVKHKDWHKEVIKQAAAKARKQAEADGRDAAAQFGL